MYRTTEYEDPLSDNPTLSDPTRVVLALAIMLLLLSGCGNQAGGTRVTSVTHEHKNEMHLFSDNGDDVDVNIDVSVVIPGEVWLNSDHNNPGAVYAQAEEIAQAAEEQLQPVADKARRSRGIFDPMLGMVCLVMLVLAGIPASVLILAGKGQG